MWSQQSREAQSNRFINPFKVIDYRGEVIAVYKNSVEAQRAGGFQSNAIRQVLNGRVKTHKPFTLYDPNKNILLYHSFKFNEQQNKAVNREIMKYRKKYNLKVD